ncbi:MULTISPECIES: hypothetical protein [Nostoc]
MPNAPCPMPKIQNLQSKILLSRYNSI